MELTIEQKILLAEEVMGWANRHEEERKAPAYFEILEEEICYTKEWDLLNCQKWQPETDEGDAARLLMIFPHVRIVKSGYSVRVRLNRGRRQFFGVDFCGVICLAALDYATDKREAREREAT